MAKSSPLETFLEAQLAMEEGDWKTFFSCLDQPTLKRLIKNGISLAMMQSTAPDSDFLNILDLHNFPSREVIETWQKGQTKLYERAIANALKTVPALSELMADIETYTRTHCHGGSVSSSLFVGEALRNVEQQDAVAWGIRQITEDSLESIKFVLKKRCWYIALFANRRLKPDV